MWVSCVTPVQIPPSPRWRRGASLWAAPGFCTAADLDDWSCEEEDAISHSPLCSTTLYLISPIPSYLSVNTVLLKILKRGTGSWTLKCSILNAFIQFLQSSFSKGWCFEWFLKSMFAALRDEAAAYHVWLLGSQVSFPTLSMQNFCGPLLPEGVKQTNKKVVSSNVSMNVLQSCQSSTYLKSSFIWPRTPQNAM